MSAEKESHFKGRTSYYVLMKDNDAKHFFLLNYVHQKIGLI